MGIVFYSTPIPTPCWKSREPLPTRRGLVHANPLVQAGTLYALEQMKSGGLTAAELLPLLNTADPALSAADFLCWGGDWAARALHG